MELDINGKVVYINKLCTSGEKDTNRGKFAAKERNKKKPTRIWHICKPLHTG